MKRTLLALAIAGLSVAAYASPPPGGGPPMPIDVNVVNPMNVRMSSGYVVDPQPGYEYEVVSLTGPGNFVSAILSKQGGANDITFVELIVDGQRVTDMSFAGLRAFGLTQNNPFGVAIFGDPTDLAGVDAVAIGFPYPIPFKTSLVLKASVGTYDTGIVQILGKVIAGE